MEGTLRRLWRQREQNVSLLQTEYYLLKGDTCPLPQRLPSAPYLLRALRERWECAVTLAREYEDASRDSPIQALYETLSETNHMEANTLRTLLQKIMKP